jgi:hypothetical protein
MQAQRGVADIRVGAPLAITVSGRIGGTCSGSNRLIQGRSPAAG